MIPALGGSERHVYTTSFPKWAQCNQMSWSPDGKSLIFPEALDNSAKARLSILSLSDLTARPLTSPHNQQFDCDPVFSPDGAKVAFARGPMGAFLSDLFVLRVGRRPTFASYYRKFRRGCRLDSRRQGNRVRFPRSRGFKVYGAFPLQGERHSRLPLRGMPMSPRSHAGGTSSLTWYLSSGTHVWRLDLKDERHALAPPVRLLSGRGIIWKPSYSPDGKKIAFESNRMGYEDIWMCDSDGSNCSQLTDRHGTSATARWSPDGRYLAFESSNPGLLAGWRSRITRWHAPYADDVS